MDFPDFLSVERYLNSLINYEHAYPLGGTRDRLKLEPTLKAAERLRLSLQLPSCVHVAGTKGKGSTVAFLEALFSPEQATLSFTSPHLTTPKERVRLCGQPLPDSVWQGGFTQIARLLRQDPSVNLTYFETIFVFFLWAARALQTRVHLVETGLGGRFDATNVLQSTLAVLTPVDYDHTDVLGNTLTEIAADKAGIIKPRSTVVLGRQPQEALLVLERAVADVHAHSSLFGSDFWWREQPGEIFAYEERGTHIESLRLSVEGLHQRDNATAAICAARRLGAPFEPGAVRGRIAACRIPARQQWLPGDPNVLLDVAHNPVSFRALADTLRARHAGKRIRAVVGMMRNKDARSSLAAVKDFVHEILVVELNSPRTLPARELGEIAQSLAMKVRYPLSREEAFASLHGARDCDLALVVGSFYLAGDYLLWRQRAGIA